MIPTVLGPDQQPIVVPQSVIDFDFQYTNDFSQWPSLSPADYPNYTHIYCTGNYTIAGKRNYWAGAYFIFQYLFYLTFYIPTLIVIARKPLINHACYKIMLAVGVIDNMFGFYVTFVAGIFSIMGKVIS